MESGITLITPTGVRPEPFDFCKMYVWRQTWTGPMQWVVVDDGIPEQKINLETFAARHIQVDVVHPRPAWIQGQNTQGRNLKAAIPHVIYDKVFFIEDDDWYAPEYVASLAGHLNGETLIVGECPAVYYNVAHQLYLQLGNHTHSSMCETGIHVSVLPILDQISASNDEIDIRLWRSVPQPQRKLVPRKYSLGIKGMPGRPGLGSGHAPNRMPLLRWAYDMEWRYLQSLIGDDYLQYKALSTKPTEGDFQIFFYLGRKYYKCNQKWPSGHACTYDHWDIQELLAHIALTHGRSKPVAPKRVSPILGPDGQPVEVEKKNP